MGLLKLDGLRWGSTSGKGALINPSLTLDPVSFIRAKSGQKVNRVGGGITPAVLPHHRTYGSVYGGSCRTFEPMILSHQRYQSESIKELLR